MSVADLVAAAQASGGGGYLAYENDTYKFYQIETLTNYHYFNNQTPYFANLVTTGDVSDFFEYNLFDETSETWAVNKITGAETQLGPLDSANIFVGQLANSGVGQNYIVVSTRGYSVVDGYVARLTSELRGGSRFSEFGTPADPQVVFNYTHETDGIYLYNANDLTLAFSVPDNLLMGNVNSVGYSGGYLWDPATNTLSVSVDANPAPEYTGAGGGSDNVTLVFQSIQLSGPALFSKATDSVNFNGLQPGVPNGLSAVQQSALQDGTDMYHGLGGSDVVVLPNEANYNESVGNGATLNWDNTQTFYTGSQVGDIYHITGGDGADIIQLGSGSDKVFGSPGDDKLMGGGSGQDTFDYQDGAFADFFGFGPTTTQTIQGGHTSFVSGAGQNAILLPGSPNDYTINVSFPGNSDAFPTTETTVTTTGADGLEPGITLDTTGIEKVQFDSFVSLPNVTLTGGSMASEALKLADEVYGYSIDTRGYHVQDPLADEAQENQNSSSFDVNAVLVSYDSASAATSRGWYALQAIDLGMAPADFLQQGGLRYSFVNGYYQAYATGDIWPFSSDRAEADALVLAGNVNGKATLAISFSGTDQQADMGDYPNFAVYYAKYKPLIDALKIYVADNGIQQILVSGHSLGAGALQYFMNDFGAASGIPVYAYTAGSPGSEVDTGDTRVVNFVHTNDLVPFAGTLSPLATVLTGIGALVSPLVPLFYPKSRAGETVLIDSDVADSPSVDEHKVALYEQDILKLESFATDANSPFETIAAAIENNAIGALLQTSAYPGGKIEIAVGQPLVFDAATGEVGGPYNAAGLASYNSNVRAYSADQYVLGNENSTGTNFIVSALDLVANSSQRIFDGASGKSKVALPFNASDFQYSQKTADGQGYQLYTLIDPASLATGVHDLVGSLYRVQQLVFLHADSGPFVVNLDGSAVTTQLPAANQTALTIVSSYDYADTGSNNLAVTGSGNGDIIAVGTGNVTINESVGNNIVFVKDVNSTGALTAHFASGDNTVICGAGTSVVTAGGGDDDFVAGSGNASFDGGGGTNTMEFSDLSTVGIVAIVQGGAGIVNEGGANGIDSLTNIQDIIDSGTGRGNGDVFEVDASENVTASSSNFNYLIELSAGVTVAFGISFTGITEFVSNVGTNTVDFSADTSFAYLFGSTGNDTLTLGSGGGYLIGEGGANVLTGGANATNLFVGGQGGTDTMNGGTGTASNYYFVDGNDQVNGAGGFNAMIELVTGVTVQLGSAQYQHVQEFVSNTGTNVVTVANTDTDFTFQYGSTGNDTLSTGSGGGYLIGEGGTNVLTGGGGLNVFVADGGAGADTMNGGSGSNVYLIDANSIVNGAGTFNTVEELQQNVSLTLGSTQLGSDVQQVVLNSGTNSADFHTATSSVFLYGGAGNDTLFGGTGNDFLYGGTGTNTFKFGTGWGQDTIEDWTAGTNSIIDLTGLTSQGVHTTTDLTQIITAGNDVITSTHTGTNSITLLGVGAALTASSFKFA